MYLVLNIETKTIHERREGHLSSNYVIIYLDAISAYGQVFKKGWSQANAFVKSGSVRQFTKKEVQMYIYAYKQTLQCVVSRAYSRKFHNFINVIDKKIRCQ